MRSIIVRESQSLAPVKDFKGYYSSVLVPNAPHVRHIRLLLDKAPTSEWVKCLDVCTNATSLALYTDSSRRYIHSIDLTLCGAILKLLGEGSLNALGIYSPWIIQSSRLNWNPERYACILLKHIIENSENPKLIKRIDLACNASLVGGPYDYIRTKLPSLEVLGITLLLQFPPDDIWPLNVTNYWAPYSNLKTLQLRGCKAVYANRIPFLVRHFLSLTHILFSIYDGNKEKGDLRIEDWYERDDALWKVRKPLETLHLEHVVDTDVSAMGEIPVKTLVITNSFGTDFISVMERAKERTCIFPRLQRIRVQPKFGQAYFGPIEKQWLSALEKFCLPRGILLTQDAEATTEWL